MNVNMEMQNKPEMKKGNTIPAQNVRVVCPTCKTGELALKSENEVYCADCNASFPVENRVINLLPGIQSHQRLVALSMEWNWMARIYETRLWRKNPLFKHTILGISFEDEYKTIVQAMDLKGDETLLDLACGPGMYARPLARKLNSGIVVGLDLSIPMLNYTSRQAHSEGLSNTLLIRGNAKDLPFPDNQFDVINCCGALHLFPEPSVVQGVCRTLKPGGRFTIGVARNPFQSHMMKKFYDYCYSKGWAKAFPQKELESLLNQGGLTNVTYHYAKRYWFIVSAEKPE